MFRSTQAVIVAATAVVMSSVLPAFASAQTAQPAPAVIERDVASELACAPRAATMRPAATIQILGGEETGRGQFAPGDRVVINAGSSHGLETGREYFIRRVVLDRSAEKLGGVAPISIHTAGWLKLVEVHTERSIGTVTQACDAIHDGDYLEPFVRPAVPASAAAGEPDFAHPARVLLAAEGRHVGATGTLMTLDRGSDHGLRPGQRLTIFRTPPDSPIVRVGDATIVAVNPESSTIRIGETRDAVYVGDKVAIHR